MSSTRRPSTRKALSRRATFWSASTVLALCLWASAAASVLYPSYEVKWHLSSVVVTSVFGTYPVALLLVLLVFGGVSDIIGRRRTMLIGIALIALSAVLFAVAPNVDGCSVPGCSRGSAPDSLSGRPVRGWSRTTSRPIPASRVR